MAIETTRPIAPHEELCVAYGPYYWYQTQFCTTNEQRPNDVARLAYIEGRRLFSEMTGDVTFAPTDPIQ